MIPGNRVEEQRDPVSGSTVYTIVNQTGKIVLITTSLLLARTFGNMQFLDTSKIPNTVYL
jgi:hypothetical protein